MSTLYPVVDVVEWADRHQISLKPLECNKCGTARAFTKPFVCRTVEGIYNGVSVEGVCDGCGDKGNMIRAVPACEKTRELWSCLAPGPRRSS